MRDTPAAGQPLWESATGDWRGRGWESVPLGLSLQGFSSALTTKIPWDQNVSSGLELAAVDRVTPTPAWHDHFRPPAPYG